MYWSILKARIHSDPSAAADELNTAKQFCVVGSKPSEVRPVRPLHAALFVIAFAEPAPGALANIFIIRLYDVSSFGCSAATLARTAVAKAGVGMFVEKLFGRTKRNPSVSKKKKVLSLITGPPTEVAHWFAFERGFAVPPLLNIQSLAFMFEPFHQYSAFPWKLLVPDLVKEMTWAPANRSEEHTSELQSLR